MKRGFSIQALIASVGLIVCLLLLLGARSVGVAQPASGGSFIEGVTAQAGINGPVNLNPLFATSDADRDISSLLFSGLTRFDGANIAPDLASSLPTLSSDGRTYTFNLRRNVVWHDGQPFSAADVLFTINLLKDKRFAVNPAVAAPWDAVQASAPDSNTVALTLPQPYAPFLGFTTIGILPAHLLGQYQDNPAQLASAPFNLQPVGSGPYRLPPSLLTPTTTAALPTSLFTLERNEAFYDATRKPLITRFAFRFYPNTSALLSGFNAGEIDGISYVAPENVATLSQRPDLRIYETGLGRTTFIFLNNRLPIFDQREVRLALSKAIDRKAIVDQTLYGQGVVADSPLLPSDLGYGRVEGGAYDYDMGKANQLLDSAGWKLAGGVRSNAAGVPLKFNLLYNSDNPYLAKAAQLIASNLAQVGVVVTAMPLGYDELVNQHLLPRNFDAALLGWQGLAYDPDAYSLWHSTQADNPDGLNFAGWINNQADLALEQGRQSSDRQTRIAAYADFQRAFASAMPSLPLYYPNYTYAVNARVQGITLPPLASPGDRFQRIAAWYVLTQLKPQGAPAQ
jgi:peptide/nickel transport system substrate-binding protein